MCVCLSINQHQCAQYIRSSVAISIVHGLKFLCLWHRILRFPQTIQLRVRSCACRSWKRAVERCSRSCGSRPNKSRITIMASARKEKSYKKRPWLPSVASTFGFHLWLPSVASVVGDPCWLPSGVFLVGFGLWFLSAARGPESAKPTKNKSTGNPKSYEILGGFSRWLPWVASFVGFHPWFLPLVACDHGYASGFLWWLPTILLGSRGLRRWLKLWPAFVDFLIVFV